MLTEEVKREIFLQVTVWIASLVLLALELHALTQDSLYKFDFFFLLFLLWGLFLFRHKIKLKPVHFLLFAVFLIAHNFGVFGFYQKSFLWIEYDYYMHAYFGAVSSFILLRTFRKITPYRGWFLAIVIIIIILGISGLHEIAEFGGAAVLGEGEGFLFEGPDDRVMYDSQIDLLNNLIGAMGGLILYSIVIKVIEEKERKRRSKIRKRKSKKRKVRRTTKKRTTK